MPRLHEIDVTFLDIDADEFYARLFADIETFRAVHHFSFDRRMANARLCAWFLMPVRDSRPISGSRRKVFVQCRA